MNKVKTHISSEIKTLTEAQVFALREAGFSQDQMDALPTVKGLTSEQIYLADSLGLFPQEEGELSADELAAMFPESVLDIDENELWQKATLVKPNKEPISIRLDADVIEYFKRPGSGYQRRINAVLRLWMKAHPNPTA
jgi:uncharacterized protein (DUF4415 family)